MKKYYIYAVLKGDDTIYIGSTISIERRIREHKRKFGKEIELKILDEYFGSWDTALALEEFWIKKYIDLGIDILNINYCKSNFEKRKTFTFSCLPSVYKAAMKRAKKEGNTLSDVIEKLLQGYVDAPVWKGVSDGIPLPPDYVRLKDVRVVYQDGQESKLK